MARTQKFPEDLLLEAVVKYTEIHNRKIKATELAEWSSTNIVGLEGVRDYHFLRSVRERDPKTGRITNTKKLCTVRIEEINRARSLTESVNKNSLLKASTIDAFMEQPDYVQRRQIAETRETVDRLLAKNASITRENEALHAENKRMQSELLRLSEKVDVLQKTQDVLSRKVNFLMKTTDEATRKSMLAQMGLWDGTVDLDVYAQSLSYDIRDAMNIRKELIKHFSKHDGVPLENMKTHSFQSLTGSVMNGLHFMEDIDE